MCPYKKIFCRNVEILLEKCSENHKRIHKVHRPMSHMKFISIKISLFLHKYLKGQREKPSKSYFS